MFASKRSRQLDMISGTLKYRSLLCHDVKYDMDDESCFDCDQSHMVLLYSVLDVGKSLPALCLSSRASKIEKTIPVSHQEFCSPNYMKGASLVHPIPVRSETHHRSDV